MKFNFKIQKYQTDAVDAVVKVFAGQGFHDKIGYIRDIGRIKPQSTQLSLSFADEFGESLDSFDDTGYKMKCSLFPMSSFLKIYTLCSRRTI